MTPAARRGLFLLSALIAGPLALFGLAGLPDFGATIPAYGETIAAVALDERRVTNLVAAVVFDYRGFDTLCEQFIIFGAVIGVAMLLRDVRGQPGGQPLDRTVIRTRPIGRSEAVTAAARLSLGITIVLGVYMLLHAHLTPGGGMQGGVILGSALLLVYLGESYGQWRRLTPPALLDAGKALAAVAYALIGAGSLLVGGAYLENMLPLGTVGRLDSGGTIPWLNLATGIGVAGGFALIFHEFLEELEPEASGETQ